MRHPARTVCVPTIMAVCVATATALRAGAEEARRQNDFPTVERVLFVEACVRDHPDRSRTEMLYKCSCVIDGLAAELSYAEYVDASTAFAAGQVAGERGTHIRESSAGQELADRFREANANSRRACIMP
jgi:hypothetical protein